ncbi:MAG: hypothetical protein ACOC3V_04050 [bacterium]
MNFIEFLEHQGKLNHKQTAEIFSATQANHEKAGQVILKKQFLPKEELLHQLEMFVNNNQ